MFLLGRETTLAFDKSFQDDLARESWTMYALGMTFILLRTYARIRRTGIKGLAPDDYLVWFAAFWYTMLVVCLNVIAGGGGSNLYPPDEYETFTPEEIKDRIKGSKIVIVSEQAMLNTIYLLKACMLFIYTRLTVQLKHRTLVKALIIYTICGYIGTQLAFFLACRPFSGYWAMPPPNAQCTTLQHYAITQACFNISSDAFMLLISLPLLLSSTLPLKQKIILSGIFGMGLFVIIAAILTKVFNLADLYSTVYMLWYVRESSVAVWVTNIPLIWPLLRETFPMLRSFTPGMRAYSNSSKTKSYGPNTTTANTNTAAAVAAGGIGVKTSTHISVVDRGYQMDILRSGNRKRGQLDSSISLDSDERELNGKHSGIGGGEDSLRDYHFGSGQPLDHDDASVKDLERGGGGLFHLHPHLHLHTHAHPSSSSSDAAVGGAGMIWDHEPEDHGYMVNIRGNDRQNSFVDSIGDVQPYLAERGVS